MLVGLDVLPDQEPQADAGQAAERFLVKQDLDFSDLRECAKRATAGVLIIRLSEPSRSRLTRRVTEIFRRTAIVVLAAELAVLAGAALYAAHQIVGGRYNSRKTTVVLSETDALVAYQPVENPGVAPSPCERREAKARGGAVLTEKYGDDEQRRQRASQPGDCSRGFSTGCYTRGSRRG